MFSLIFCNTPITFTSVSCGFNTLHRLYHKCTFVILIFINYEYIFIFKSLIIGLRDGSLSPFLFVWFGFRSILSYFICNLDLITLYSIFFYLFLVVLVFNKKNFIVVLTMWKWTWVVPFPSFFGFINIFSHYFLPCKVDWNVFIFAQHLFTILMNTRLSNALDSPLPV